MSKRQWQALAVVLALLAGTVIVLMRVGGNHHLGVPGVKVVAEPTYMEGGKVVHNESVGLPIVAGEFSSEPVEITSLEVNWLPKDTVYGRRLYYGKDGFTNATTVILMGADRTSIHKPQYCLDGQGWHIDTTETVVIPISRPHPYDLRAMKLTASKVVLDATGRLATARAIYVYWFVADKELTPYHGERMWWMARDLLRYGVLQRWAYVSYLTICSPGQEEIYFNRLKDAMAATVPEFQLAVGPVRAVGKTAAINRSSVD
jgi:hypothetical protein